MRYTLDGRVGRQPAMVHGGDDGRTYSGVWPGGQAAENVLPDVCVALSEGSRSPLARHQAEAQALIRHARSLLNLRSSSSCCWVGLSSWATSLRGNKCFSLRQYAMHSAHLSRALAQLRVPSFCKHVQSPRQPFSRLNGTIFDAQVTVTTDQKVVTALRKDGLRRVSKRDWEWT